MKEILNSYVSYNVWANETLLNLVNDHYNSLLDKEVESSFKSLRKTFFHIWDAEFIWKRRIEGESIADFPSKKYSNEIDLNLFVKNSKSFENLISEMHENQFKSLIKYNNIKGESFETSVAEIVHHCMNHSTFHRGQIVTILRVLGAQNIPSTDLITYIRNKK